MEAASILKELKSFADENFKEGMKRFGINSEKAYGVKIPVLRKYAKKFRFNHSLALALWETKIHEARLLASMIDNPKEVTEEQMEKWVKDFNSWDICDQTCGNLFDKTIYAFDKALTWSKQKEEYVKRAGFVMMAELAVHDKKAANKLFLPFFTRIESEAGDERNHVKKAVNWALRQLGKRNIELYKQAVLIAQQIKKQPSKSAQWVAADALKELQSKNVILRLKQL